MLEPLLLSKIFKLQTTRQSCCTTTTGFIFWSFIAFLAAMFIFINNFLSYSKKERDNDGNICFNYGDLDNECFNPIILLLETIFKFILSFAIIVLIIAGNWKKKTNLITYSQILFTILYYTHLILTPFLWIVNRNRFNDFIVPYLLVWIVLEFYFIFLNAFKNYVDEVERSGGQEKSNYEAFA
jgi:hypothetical protein